VYALFEFLNLQLHYVFLETIKVRIFGILYGIGGLTCKDNDRCPGKNGVSAHSRTGGFLTGCPSIQLKTSKDRKELGL
jgi:hypothetical protein